MTKNNENAIILKAYSLKELAHIYGIDWRTLKNWLRPFEEEIGKKEGRYYKIPQVKIIFGKLGLPSYIIPGD
jgi:hypothetical protein